MDKTKILELLQKNIRDILPELKERPICSTDSLKDLGANSIDRAEIIIEMLRSLKLKIPLATFGLVKNIEDIVDVFYEEVLKSCS